MLNVRRTVGNKAGYRNEPGLSDHMLNQYKFNVRAWEGDATQTRGGLYLKFLNLKRANFDKLN